ncbi:MAG: DUF4383 domain-containing protein [Verrucomicrobiota bacterium]
MLKTASIIFGIVFLIIGILGLIPAAAPNGMLLGIFHVNGFHNAVHLLTGVIAIIAGVTGSAAARLFFQVFGIIYAIVALLGFFYGGSNILGVLANNIPDAWLHVLIAVVALYFGFVWAEERHPAATR